MSRKPPAKSRRTKADCSNHKPPRQGKRDDKWDARSAPSHLGGQFDEAGYGPGGGFGFQIFHPNQ